MAYPTPVTKTDEFLLAIVLKLEEIRVELGKLNTSPTINTEPPTINNTIQLDANKVAATINNALLAAGIDTTKRNKTKP